MLMTPTDWSDQQGWEKYYVRLLDSDDLTTVARNTGSISINQVNQFADELRANSVQSIWLPGCGVSLLPKLLCRAGFDVYATDISETAVVFQLENSDERVNELIAESGIDQSSEGNLKVEVQDFRKGYLPENFDIILNIKAIQGVDNHEMVLIAKVHFDSLRPGRTAIFDTMNVQGERRESLEAAIVSAGFFLPFYELSKDYRRKLADTGFPYVFVLGSPMIPRVGEYEDEMKWETDVAVLRSIWNEFREKQVTHQNEIKQHYDRHPETKTASLIYSTG